MYSDKNLVHILTILEATEKIYLYVRGIKTADDFLWHDDQKNFNASVALLIAIGEETKKINDSLRKEFPEINWSAIAGMRDRLAHHYRGIDPEITWELINNNLDELKSTLIDMLPKIKFERNMLLAALDSEYYKHLKYLR
jgi:uncharacterized protein with HEPN domain